MSNPPGSPPPASPIVCSHTDEDTDPPVRGSGARDGLMREGSLSKIDREELGNNQTWQDWLRELKHWFVRLYFRAILFAFYREIDCIGVEHVPAEGPVIFCGNHQNQFVDALMLYCKSPRTVGFIIAAKSMKRRVVGTLARLMDCIPVRRPQDEARPGKGTVVGWQGRVLRGAGTAFTADVKVGDLLSFKWEGRILVAKVSEVHSDDSLALKDALTEEEVADVSVGFRVLPKIDHADMYDAVYGTMRAGNCIGIFPEGGSHDRTSLLPMKDGVARFALGAAAQGIMCPVVPVGLTYYYGHRFRSRAHVEYGRPLYVPADLVELYKDSPQEATKELMKLIEARLRGVTINTPDWRSLKLVHHVRRLYQPPNVPLSAEEQLRLTRRIATWMDKMQCEDDEAASAAEPAAESPREGPKGDFYVLRDHIERYQKLLKSYLLKDAQVESLNTLQARTSYSLLLFRCVFTAAWFIASLPGLTVALPVMACSRVYGLVKSKEALAASTVKLRGNDVKASYKIIMAMVMLPLVMLGYAIVTWAAYGRFWAALVFCFMPVLSYFSVVWFNYAMDGARSSFPLLLSLHSEKYLRRFKTLHEYRQQLVEHVFWIVRSRVRGGPGWSSRSESLYQRIKDGRLAPEGTADLFGVRHGGSRRLRNVGSADSLPETAASGLRHISSRLRRRRRARDASSEESAFDEVYSAPPPAARPHHAT